MGFKALGGHRSGQMDPGSRSGSSSYGGCFGSSRPSQHDYSSRGYFMCSEYGHLAKDCL